MGQWDFLNDDGTEEILEPEWHHEPVEDRQTDIVDSRGRRIGYRIKRLVRIVSGSSPTHARWVSVTKDGEPVDNRGTTFHATREDAEAWVEKRIHDSICRYREAAQRGPTYAAGDFDFSRPAARPRRRPKKTFVQSLDDAQRGLDAAGKNLTGCGCALILLGLLILSPFFAVLFL